MPPRGQLDLEQHLLNKRTFNTHQQKDFFSRVALGYWENTLSYNLENEKTLSKLPHSRQQVRGGWSKFLISSGLSKISGMEEREK